jgi:hypothetical protein
LLCKQHLAASQHMNFCSAIFCSIFITNDEASKS